ncbi:MAG: hypothetical protein WCP16_01585 [Pseudanabaena sp. ELA645]|jgi:hypothetical protein
MSFALRKSANGKLEEELKHFENGLKKDTWGQSANKNSQGFGARETIDEFQRYVNTLDGGYNKRYKDRLIAKDGILEKYRQKIDKMLSDQKTTGVGLQSISTNILTANPNDPQSIDVEVVANPQSVNAPNLSEDFRKLRRDEMKLCKADLEEGVITQEEYEREIEKIRLKYPI